MVFNIEVNNRPIQARKGETILTALRRNGIHVPTLCNMKDFSPTGACRMCVVEVEGKDGLIPSCSHPVEEWMHISTHTPRVIKARKTIVELLLSNHPDDCLYCERSGNCELQKMAEDLNVRERRIPGKKGKYKIDKSSAGIVRDPSKCILCGRCVRICEEMQAVSTLDFIQRGSKLLVATAMSKPLNFSNCISCGQCVVVCPTGALTEKMQFTEIDQALFDHQKKVVVQYSSAVAVSIAEEFGLRPSADLHGILNSALRKIGFDKVFDTGFAAEVMIMEQSSEFVARSEKEPEKLPLITGFCPSWIKYAEQFLPWTLPHISSVKSPQQIMASLIRSWYATIENIKPSDIYSVAITTCTSKKAEAQRPEMTSHGMPDIDTVLTSRELVRLIRLHGIDMLHLDPEPADEPLLSTGSAGKLFGVSGGSLEALLRTVYYNYTGDELSNLRLSKLRLARHLKEMTLKVGTRDLNIAAVSGMINAVKLLEDIKAGRKYYDIVEITACAGGCINGGGQPIRHDELTIRNRAKAIYDLDNKNMIKVAHKNPSIKKVYSDFFEGSITENALELIHYKNECNKHA